MKKVYYLFCLVLFFLFVFQLDLLAKPVTFVVDDELGRNNVSFTSDAPIELIVGRTTKIKGKLIIDDSLDLKKSSVDVLFNVDLASIDTGIPLRNEHMRDNFLETKKYPEAIFKVRKISPDSPAKLAEGQPLKLLASGDFKVHGITVKKDIPVKVTYFKESDFTHNKFKHGDVIRIQSTFDVPLEEHKIKRPEVIWQKLTDTVTVSVDAYANQSSL
ncbi:MAG: YceI family protein [Candidatus Melainabacteria bacterium]|nr:YceI family protein [Candidatus Melainabacteria bacterium]